MKNVLALLTSLVLSYCAPAMAGTALYDDIDKSLHLTGGTDMQQVIAAHSALTTREVDVVYMSGPGGELRAGLKLGAVLSRHNIHVVVSSGTRCMSACAFAALGGKTMTIRGELGFHSPYLMGVPTGVTLNEIGKVYAIGSFEATKHILDMGYPLALAEIIVKETSPCEFIVVSGDGTYSWLHGPDRYERDDPHLKVYTHNNCQEN